MSVENSIYLDPRKTFFITTAIIPKLGLSKYDIRDSNSNIFATLDEALEYSKERTDEYGIEMFIYECRPVKRVYRSTIVRTTTDTEDI